MSAKYLIKKWAKRGLLISALLQIPLLFFYTEWLFYYHRGYFACQSFGYHGGSVWECSMGDLIKNFLFTVVPFYELAYVGLWFFIPAVGIALLGSVWEFVRNKNYV